MTIDHRKTGWLDQDFHLRFRERLTHTAFRYGVILPLYCLMPDHLHLMMLGYRDDSDQRKAIRFLRRQLNCLLKPRGYSLQLQPHDRVLRDEERAPDAFTDLAWYIRANPHRAGLVESEEALASYPYSGCLAPGYPELDIWAEDFWERFWRIFTYLAEQKES